MEIQATQTLNHQGWQARQDSNPQPPVLETDALPVELLAYPSHARLVDAPPFSASRGGPYASCKIDNIS